MSDADQFEAFVRRYQDLVFSVAARLLSNEAEAEDAAQTVFLKAYQRFASIGADPGAAGWLRTVTRNVCLNHLSRYRRRLRLFSELEPPAGEDSTDGYEATLLSTDSPALEVERAGRLDRLEHALRRLPDHQRVPLVLFHFENATYQEIADALGVSLGKVKTDIHRGRMALKQHLTRDDQ
jgi:RNA polymerase sigma-70 factor (ECF subfamily)